VFHERSLNEAIDLVYMPLMEGVENGVFVGKVLINRPNTYAGNLCNAIGGDGAHAVAPKDKPKADVRVADYLSRARDAESRGALIEPAEDNARVDIESAHAISPDDPAVAQAQGELRALLEEAARRALDAANPDQADRLASAALDAGADPARVNALHDDAQQLRAKARSASTGALASTFNERLSAGRLIEPAGDSARSALAQLVQDAVADAAAVEPGRPVYAEAPPHLLAVVDEPRIRQVLANLIGNVREHTPPDTPVAVRLAEAGQGVMLVVADSGPGMSAEHAARVFDRFHRGPTDKGSAADGYGGGASPNGNRGGSGLGLSIVQAIARAHGGDAAIESAPGRGTRVRVWLPTRLTAPQPER